MGEMRLAPIGHPRLSEDEANRRCNALADPKFCRQFWDNQVRPDNRPAAVPFPTGFRADKPVRHLRVVREIRAA